MPALKSNWLLIHVVTAFLGYAAFALAFGTAILYLVQQRRPRASLPPWPNWTASFTGPRCWGFSC